MTVYQTKAFVRFARKTGLAQRALMQAAAAVAAGNFDADLGGRVFKQRVARPGGGKSGGFRTILIYEAAHCSIFVHGFAKSAKANISAKELAALKRLADELLGMNPAQLEAAVAAGALVEVMEDDGDEKDDRTGR